jgi:hypothetical protein
MDRLLTGWAAKGLCISLRPQSVSAVERIPDARGFSLSGVRP